MQISGNRKIIIIGPAYPYRGGPSTFVSYIYKVIKNNFTVKIYNYKLLYPEFLFPGTTQYDESIEKKFIVPSERIVNSINPFNWIAAALRIRKENAALVIFDWWHPFFGPCHFIISLLIKPMYKKKILFITENFISHEQNKVDKILTRIGLRNAGAYLALSAAVEEDLRAAFPGKRIYRSELPSFDIFSEVPGIDRSTSRAGLGFNDNDKVLLFFGYVRKYKGLDLLIEAMPEVLSRIPEAKLLIVGEFYDNVEYYKDIIERYGIQDKVLMLNKFVANEEVGKFYSAADLNVLPYRSATQSAVLNVSYSFRKPVVATDVGGLSEFIKDEETGIIVKTASPGAIAEGIIKFFSLRGNINFRENIEKMLGENKFSELPDLLERIINDLDS